MNAALMLSRIETEMLINLVDLLVAGKHGVDPAEWQLQKLQQLGRLQSANVSMIKKNRKELIRTVKAEISKEAYNRAALIDGQMQLAFDDGAKDKLSQVLPVSADPQIKAVVEKWETAAEKAINKTFATMLAKCDEMYTDTIFKAVAKSQMGMSSRQAIAEACSEWSQQGLKALTDSAGRTWTPEAYAQTIVRTNSTQAATETQFQRMEELDEDLVEISSHIGARPKCAPYQGKVFSVSGKSKQFPALSSTSYGEPDGLFGINCRHIMYPYFVGEKKTYKQQPVKRNESAYKNSQKQRAYERSIREAKRNLKILSATKDKDQIAKANELLAKRQNALKSFISTTGRTRRTDREEIY